MEDEKKRERIAALNDLLRQRGQGGEVVVTSRVMALAEEIRERIFQAVREFSDFTEDNNPHQERDFGMVEVDGEKAYFKHDYYDESKESGSEDPSNPDITRRVMTIMLTVEY